MDYITIIPHDIIIELLSQINNQSIISYMSTSKNVWKNNNLWLRIIQLKKFKQITNNYKNDYKTNYVLQKFLNTNDNNKMFDKESLYFSNLKNFTIPQEITHLKNIKTLNIDHCNLKSLNMIYKLNLSSLTLSYMNLKIISNNIALLTGLTFLDLSYNNLKILPKEFGKLRNLEQLFLDNNKIRTLSIEFKKLNHLITLDLSNNKLEQLPFSFDLFKHLESLNLSGNPNYKKIDN